MSRRVQGDAALPLGARQDRPGRRVPATIELVVAVQHQAIVEAGEHGLAARIDGGHRAAFDPLLEALQLREPEVRLDDLLADEDRGDLVGRTPDFRTFGHRSG